MGQTPPSLLKIQRSCRLSEGSLARGKYESQPYCPCNESPQHHHSVRSVLHEFDDMFVEIKVAHLFEVDGTRHREEKYPSLGHFEIYGA